MASKTKVVVTGGAGFIGSNLADALIEKGFDVHIIDNLSTGKKENINKKAKFYKKDILNLKSIQPIINGAEYVFHLATIPQVQYSIKNPVESNRLNVDGTLNILIASQKAKVKKVIYSSSCSVYGDQNKMPISENQPVSPKSPYGLQKYIGEIYCRLFSSIYGLPTVSLRYFNVYGLRQSSEGAYSFVVAKFLKQKSLGKPMVITGDGKQTRDFINVKDVVEANLLAMQSKKVGKGEVINIGSGRESSVLKIAKLVGGPVTYVPRLIEPRRALSDNKLATKFLNWKPKISLEKGIEELKDIYINNFKKKVL